MAEVTHVEGFDKTAIPRLGVVLASKFGLYITTQDPLIVYSSTALPKV